MWYEHFCGHTFWWNQDLTDSLFSYWNGHPSHHALMWIDILTYFHMKSIFLAYALCEIDILLLSNRNQHPCCHASTWINILSYFHLKSIFWNQIQFSHAVFFFSGMQCPVVFALKIASFFETLSMQKTHGFS